MPVDDGPPDIYYGSDDGYPPDAQVYDDYGDSDSTAAAASPKANMKMPQSLTD